MKYNIYSSFDFITLTSSKKNKLLIAPIGVYRYNILYLRGDLNNIIEGYVKVYRNDN